MGLFLAYFVLKTGSIFPAITAHTINNAVATTTAGLEYADWILWPSLFLGAFLTAGSLYFVARRHRGAERAIVW
jgi:membrane protease YdiL (CAAX protease family)